MIPKIEGIYGNEIKCSKKECHWDQPCNEGANRVVK